MLTRRTFLASSAAAAAFATAAPLRSGRAESPGLADLARAGHALMAAYPDDIVGVEANAIVLVSGERMPIDDGIDKSFEQRLEMTDLQDMFHDPYPWGAEAAPPAHNFDPGRYRADALFKAMYGASQAAVSAQLTEVGTLEVEALPQGDDKPWRLTFDVRGP